MRANKLIIPVIFFYLFINYEIAYSQLESFKISQVVNIYSETDTNKIFGKGIAATADIKGNIYFGGTTDKNIRVLNSQGDLIAKMGRGGRGPGEFQSITSIGLTASEDTLYALDDKNHMILSFNLKNYEFINSIKINEPITPLTKLYVNENHIVLTGHFTDTEDIIKVYNKKGNLLTTAGDHFLNIDDPIVRNSSAIVQVAQLYMGFDRNEIYSVLGAPYKISKLNSNYTEIWTVTDQIIPNPLDEHIEVSLASYNARAYPQVTSVAVFPEKYIAVSWINFDSEEAFIDIRNKKDGDLVERIDFKFDEPILKLKSIDSNTGLIVTKSKVNFSLSLYEIRF